MAKRTNCRFFIPVLTVGAALVALMPELSQAQVATTLDNFFLKGTQPDTSGGVDFAPIVSAENCRQCHEFYNPFENLEYPIYSRWEGSMMANAARDPVWHAALAIANQDAAFSGDFCIRCHSPGGWLGGRSAPADGSALRAEDMEGVTCNFCHRVVDPVSRPGVNPPEDDPIRSALSNAGLLPTSPGGGNFVVDPNDVRRGPFPFVEGGPNPPPNVPNNFHFPVPILYSPFHLTSELCATCHDMSNPAMTRQPDGSYALNPLGDAHATQDKYDMFPIERTFSEWANSLYASMGVQANGVFGGNHATGVMRTCQDCHMPKADTYGCALEVIQRPDVPAHDFNGGNASVQDMLYNLYPFTLTYEYLADSKARARYMLENASTLEVTNEGCAINVRIVNETGHKLPTGYPEGRRLWINVEFFDGNLQSVAERGAYDGDMAELTASDTRVYEVELGLDAAMSVATGVPEGPSFHFVLNNKVYKDNRIPPRGFANAAFQAVQAAPVAASYADGQYWDDTGFRVPPGARSAVVSVYYQTASKEYIGFLRDENRTNDAGNELYTQWQATGMSPPVLMRQQSVFDLMPGLFGDADCSGFVDLLDLGLLGDCVTGPNRRLILGCEALDSETDGDVDLRDVAAYQRSFDGPP
ncbi:MAG: multiheme c-type cytochrome [Phycisphaerales bacterium]|nr:multiheme c-type cytochrome [Phycisphaerales bacterium]